MNIVKAESIEGWMTSIELAWLAEQAREAERILELGCFKGRSTRALADNTPGYVLAVDRWHYDPHLELNDAEIYSDFCENLKEHIEVGRVIPLKQEIADFQSDTEFDFIFIDADHRYEAVKRDIHLAPRYCRQSGIIAGHDYSIAWPGVKQAVDEIFPGAFSLIRSIWYRRIQ